MWIKSKQRGADLMIECSKTGMYYANGQWVADDQDAAAKLSALGFEAAREARLQDSGGHSESSGCAGL